MLLYIFKCNSPFMSVLYYTFCCNSDSYHQPMQQLFPQG